MHIRGLNTLTSFVSFCNILLFFFKLFSWIILLFFFWFIVQNYLFVLFLFIVLNFYFVVFPGSFNLPSILKHHSSKPISLILIDLSFIMISKIRVIYNPTITAQLRINKLPFIYSGSKLIPADALFCAVKVILPIISINFLNLMIWIIVFQLLRLNMLFKLEWALIVPLLTTHITAEGWLAKKYLLELVKLWYDWVFVYASIYLSAHMLQLRWFIRRICNLIRFAIITTIVRTGITHYFKEW